MFLAEINKNLAFPGQPWFSAYVNQDEAEYPLRQAIRHGTFTGFERAGDRVDGYQTGRQASQHNKVR